LQGSETRSRNRLSFPDLGFDLRRAFAGGAWLSVQTDERANGLSLRVTFTGTRDFSGVLPMFRDELASQLAAQHDKRELRVLSDALRAWKVQNAQALADATEDDRKALL